MRVKEATPSPGKRTIAESYSGTLVERTAVMLLIPEPAGVLADNRTSNSKAVSTISRFVFRRVSFVTCGSTLP